MSDKEQPKRREAVILAAKMRRSGPMKDRRKRREKDAKNSWQAQENNS